jgi:membrane-associated phospholipid phosphatase
MSTAAQPQPPSISRTGLLVTGWSAAVIAFGIFFVLAVDVSTHTDIVVLDAKVAAWLHTHATPETVAFLYAVTTIHSSTGTALLVLAFGAVLVRLKEWYWLLTLALGMGGGMALNVLLKHAYARARPHFDDPFVTEASYSFPSGHTAGATLFYGVVVAFLVAHFFDWRQRTACIAGGVLAVALVAYSRMYLGAHYLSDIIAAVCSSLVWLVLCLSAVHSLVRRRRA